MAGMHTHADDAAISSSTRRTLVIITASIGALTILAAALLWPEGRYPLEEDVDRYGDLYDATVVALDTGPCIPGDRRSGRCTFATVTVQGGPDAGSNVSLELPSGEAAPSVNEGQDIVVVHYTNPEAVEAGITYEFVDVDRKPVLLWLALLFAGVVVLLGRLRGLAALAGLAATASVLLVFVLPAILEGRPPLLVAVIGASAIAFVALYSSHGFRPMTTVALLGTLVALGLTALLGTAFTELAEITGLASEEVRFLQFSVTQVDFAGVVLAGLVIGALGAIDDVTVTQASAVWELRAVNPDLPRPELVRAALRIGRDHIASTVNTLVLAYAGGAITLMLLFVVSGRALSQVANTEVVAVEIVRTLVGSIGLVASVPITTWLAARTAAAPTPRR